MDKYSQNINCFVISNEFLLKETKKGPLTRCYLHEHFLGHEVLETLGVKAWSVHGNGILKKKKQ